MRGASRGDRESVGDVGARWSSSPAIEERARQEMGMLRPDEVFFQFVPGKPSSAPDSAAKLP